MNYFRRVYTILDLLSDLGGLFSSSKIICVVLLTIFQFYGSYQFVMNDLFSHNKHSRKNSLVLAKGRINRRPTQKKFKYEPARRNYCCQVMRLNIQTFVRPKLPCKCINRPLSREQHQLSKTYDHVLTLVSISNIIKQLRVLNAAAAQSMTRDQWKQLKNEYEVQAYSELDSDSSTDHLKYKKDDEEDDFLKQLALNEQDN